MTLEELTLAIEAELPQPDPAFVEELDARVEAGFPRPSRIRLPRPRLLALGGGLAAAAAAAAAIVVIAGQHPASKTVARQPAPQAARPAPDLLRMPDDANRAADQGLRAPPVLEGTPGSLPAHRLVQRSAEVTLAAPNDRLQQVADGAAAVAVRHHGFVQHESVSAGSPDPGGSLELRVPVGELDATLRDLAGLARVRARTETADDLTRRYATATGDLAKARARRADLARRIAHATSTAEADRLRAALSSVDLRIRRLTSSVRTINQETHFADVLVTLQVDRRGAATGSSTHRALHDALGILVGAVDFGIRALAVLIPLGLVAAALVAIFRGLRRRRREAVLA